MGLSDDADRLVSITALFGSISLDTWFKFESGRIIGMSGKTTYDKDGKFVSYEESPTGIEMRYE